MLVDNLYLLQFQNILYPIYSVFKEFIINIWRILKNKVKSGHQQEMNANCIYLDLSY